MLVFWLFRHYYLCRREFAIRPFVVNESYRCNQYWLGLWKRACELLRVHLKNTDFSILFLFEACSSFQEVGSCESNFFWCTTSPMGHPVGRQGWIWWREELKACFAPKKINLEVESAEISRRRICGKISLWTGEIKTLKGYWREALSRSLDDKSSKREC